METIQRTDEKSICEDCKWKDIWSCKLAITCNVRAFRVKCAEYKKRKN
jgi:hypothetical protein